MSYQNITDAKIKHLEMIQSIITRMNSNSFVIKGWVITIVSAVLALLATTNNKSFVFITGLPILVFWVLDSMYLQTERKFRTLYEQTISENSIIPAFNLDIKTDSIQKDKKNGYFHCLFSPTIAGFYGILFLLAVTCIFFLQEKNSDKEPVQIHVSAKDTLKVKSLVVPVPNP